MKLSEWMQVVALVVVAAGMSWSLAASVSSAVAAPAALILFGVLLFAIAWLVERKNL